MSPYEQAFLENILARPDDDTPRLIFADWLEDTCQPPQPERAEFIRVQCEFEAKYAHHAENGHDHPDRPGCVLRRRERELFQADDARTLSWFGLPQPWARVVRLVNGFELDDTPYPYAVARRGFLHTVGLASYSWLENHAAIVAAAPIRKVALGTLPQLYSANFRGDGRLSLSSRDGTGVPVGYDLSQNTFALGVYGASLFFPPERYRAAVLELLGLSWPTLDFTLPEVSLRGERRALRGTGGTVTINDEHPLRVQEWEVRLNLCTRCNAAPKQLGGDELCEDCRLIVGDPQAHIPLGRIDAALDALPRQRTRRTGRRPDWLDGEPWRKRRK